MLLILSTIWLVLYTKRLIIVFLFVIISHSFFLFLEINSTFGNPAATLLSGTVSLVVGITLYAWKCWYIRSSSECLFLGKLRKFFSIIVIIFLLINAFLIYLGVLKGINLVDLAESRAELEKSKADKVIAKANLEKYSLNKVDEYLITSSSGHEYIVTCNENGYVIKSKYPVSRFLGDIAYTKPSSTYEAVSLDEECRAYVNSLGAGGSGKWCWANGGVSLEFPKLNIGFPRQELRCKSYDLSIHKCRC